MIKLFTKKRKGFTLIELVVVIAILGILAAIAIPRFTQMTDKANQSAFESTHRTIVAAVQMYMAANDGATPAGLTNLSEYLNDTSSISKPDDAKPDGATYEVSNGKVTSVYSGNTLEWEP